MGETNSAPHGQVSGEDRYHPINIRKGSGSTDHGLQVSGIDLEIVVGVDFITGQEN